MKHSLLFVAIVAIACSRHPLAERDGGSASMGGGGRVGSAGAGGAAVGDGGTGGAGIGGFAGDATGGASGTGGSAEGGAGGTGGGEKGGAGGGTGGVEKGGGGGGTGGVEKGGAGGGTGGVEKGGAGGGTGGVEKGGAGGGTGGVEKGGAGGSGGAGGLQPGQPCTSGAECAKGFCVDGVCCNSACVGACRSCILAGAVGQCGAVPVGVQDPRAICVAQSPATCATNGHCDGNGGCQNYVAGTVCMAPTCSGDRYSSAAVCSGAGTCVSPAMFSCAPYRCDASGTRCATMCTADPDCTSGICMNGVCRTSPIATCVSNNECASGFCAQNVCCASACAGPCNSCALLGTIGTCTPVPNPDPSWNCPSSP